MDVFGYIACVLMGVTLGLLGGGGSILTVPILVYLFGLSATDATLSSLFVVGFSALLGSVVHWRNQNVRIGTAASFATASVLGVLVSRAYVVPRLPDQIAQIGSFTLTRDSLLMLAFAALMIVSSMTMIRVRKAMTQKRETGWVRIVITGFGIGAVAGFVGAGGGFLIVPALVMLLGFGMRDAVGTSLAVIAIQSLAGFGVGVAAGARVDWDLLLTITVVAGLGIAIGSIMSKSVNEAKLKKGFGWLVLIMGSAVLIEQIFKNS